MSALVSPPQRGVQGGARARRKRGDDLDAPIPLAEYAALMARIRLDAGIPLHAVTDSPEFAEALRAYEGGAA